MGVRVTSRPDPCSVFAQQLPQASVIEGVKRLGASANVAVTDGEPKAWTGPHGQSLDWLAAGD
jgi:hypothetical protein